MENGFGFLLAGFLAVILSAPVIILLQRKGAYVHKSQKIIDAAKAAGRVAEGKLVRLRRSRGIPESTKSEERAGSWFYTYEYAVAGKTYRYHGQSEFEPPQELPFYYPEGKPGRAVHEGTNAPGAKVVILTVLPLVLWAAIYYLVFQ